MTTTANIFPNDSIAHGQKKAYQAAYEDASRLDMLISASDIRDTATGWSDVTDEEIAAAIRRSLDVIRSEGRFDGLVQELAALLYMNDMPRLPMNHLDFNTTEGAIRHGYWPHKVANFEIHAQLLESDVEIPTEYHSTAWEHVSAGIADKMNPREDSRYGD